MRCRPGRRRGCRVVPGLRQAQPPTQAVPELVEGQSAAVQRRALQITFAMDQPLRRPSINNINTDSKVSGFTAPPPVLPPELVVPEEDELLDEELELLEELLLLLDELLDDELELELEELLLELELLEELLEPVLPLSVGGLPL